MQFTMCVHVSCRLASAKPSGHTTLITLCCHDSFTMRVHVWSRFKLALAKPSGHATVVAGDEASSTDDLANCPQLSPKRVIGDFLRFFFQFAIIQVQNQWPTYQADDAAFVMTVPAGWSDFAKATMREAAVDAGIITSVSSK